ncbi:sodium:calcium antiporter, partial [Candidatus Dojkabacteria bacterium]|nr:sodium:calcium antiporter [Candidatus Dojkabacteria bacterium]
LGIAAVIKPIKVQKLVATRDIPFSIASVFVFSLLAMDIFFGNSEYENVLTTSDGLILLLFFLIFVYYVAFSHREHHEIKSYSVKEKIEVKILLAILGLILLIAGGALVVENAVIIAQNIGVSERIIGLTIVSIGTSLPELITILVSVSKDETDIGVGNIIGSNIVNLLFILGTNIVVSPIIVPDGIGIDIIVLLIGTMLLIASLFLGKRNKVDRPEGFFFLVIYCLYIITLFR